MGTPHAQAIGDLALIAFYYFLCIGKYTVKGKRNNTKQTVQFKFKDISFFKRNKAGTLVCLPKDAPPSLIMMADSATLKLDNQKNGWKGMCIHQEANVEQFNCPVMALAHRVFYLRNNGAKGTTLFSSFFNNDTHYDARDEDISRGLKMAATFLQYPAIGGIPIDRINTHSLQSGGVNALALSGYSDTLMCYSVGMTRDMKHNFKFVNIAGNAYHDVTSTCIEEDYNLNCWQPRKRKMLQQYICAPELK